MAARRLVVLALIALAFASASFGSTSTQQGDVFYVVGYVKNPGKYLLKEDMTVGQGIELAGGLSRAIREIAVVRRVDGQNVTIPVALEERIQANDTISPR